MPAIPPPGVPAARTVTQTAGKLDLLCFVDGTGDYDSWPSASDASSTIPGAADWIYDSPTEDYQARCRIAYDGFAFQERVGGVWGWQNGYLYGKTFSLVSVEHSTSFVVGDGGLVTFRTNAQALRVSNLGQSGGTAWGGVVQTSRSGATAARPALPSAAHPAGYQFFDTTLNRPIWVRADGAGWVRADGTAA